MSGQTELEDLFRPFGPVAIKRMFGGHGIYADGLMFALEAGGEVYLKVDAESLPQFEAESLRPFTYETKHGRQHSMSYYLLPATAYDDDEVLKHWAGLGLAAARRAGSAKKAVSKKAVSKKVAPKTPVQKKATPKKAAPKKRKAASGTTR